MAKPQKRTRILRDINRVKRDVKKKARGGMRHNASRVLAQSTVAAPRRNFGTSRANNGLAQSIKALDARIPRTLGLPRAVGPYTVIRTTRLHRTSASFVMFAPFMTRGTSTGWNNWCGIEDVNAAADVTAANNTLPILMPISELGEAAEVVPASLTVQVVNPAALQAASGLFAMTRVNQQLNLQNSPATVTWNEIKARVISYYSPRILAGGKLALRGVKANAYPLDMSEYADFAKVNDTAGTAFTWNSGSVSRSAALSPIVFMQENNPAADIDFMITMEWRVRFDPGNPATSSHTHHEVTSDSTWNSVIRAMSSAGHGVEELTEDVAEAGALAATVGVML